METPAARLDLQAYSTPTTLTTLYGVSKYSSLFSAFRSPQIASPSFLLSGLEV